MGPAGVFIDLNYDLAGNTQIVDNTAKTDQILITHLRKCQKPCGFAPRLQTQKKPPEGGFVRISAGSDIFWLNRNLVFDTGHSVALVQLFIANTNATVCLRIFEVAEGWLEAFSFLFIQLNV